MSGFAGLWNIDGRPVEREVLAAMDAPIAHRGRDAFGSWSEGPFGLAARLTRIDDGAEHQPFIAGQVAVVFDGWLDDREVLVASLGDTALASRSDAEVVAAAYRRFGTDFAARLNGEFALAVVDHASRQVVLARDAMAVRSLHYYCDDRLLVFGSEVKALLAHPSVHTAPNEETLIELLLKGPEPADDAATCFENIRRVLPGEVVTISSAGTARRIAWDFDTTRKTRCKSAAEYHEAYRHYFEQAVRRRMRGARVAVSVSGGLDSSGIFCMAEQIARSGSSAVAVLGLSYSPPDGSSSDETGYLAAIERQTGAKIERLPLETPGPLAGGRECLWQVEYPTLDVLWDTTARVHRRAAGAGAKVLLTGHWADQVLFDDAYLADLLRRFRWPSAWRQLREHAQWFTDADPRLLRNQALLNLARCYIPTSFQPALKRRRRRQILERHTPRWFSLQWRTRAMEPLRATVEFRRPGSTAHASALYRVVRSRFYQHCMEWNDKVGALNGVQLSFPFLDRELVQFLMSLPGEVQSEGGVPKGLHRNALRGIMPDEICARRWKADFSERVNAAMASDYQAMVDEFRRQRLVVEHGYVDDAVLTAELTRVGQRVSQSKGNCADAWQLSDLIALEWWLRMFFGAAARREQGEPFALTSTSSRA